MQPEGAVEIYFEYLEQQHAFILHTPVLLTNRIANTAVIGKKWAKQKLRLTWKLRNKKGAQFLTAILSIDGVHNIIIDTYSIEVTVGTVFDESAIKDIIIDIFADTYEIDRKILIIGEYRQMCDHCSEVDYEEYHGDEQPQPDELDQEIDNQEEQDLSASKPPTDKPISH